MHRSRATRVACGCLLIGLTAVGALGQDADFEAADAVWLTDLARDYGLMQKGFPEAADVAHVSALLDAALRLDPNCVDALLARYESALWEGDRARVGETLNRLVNAAPEHVGAALRWLGFRISEGQTIEAWQTFLLAVKNDVSRPKFLRAHAAAVLAQMNAAQMDDQVARRLIREALTLDADHPPVALAAFDLRDADAPLPERLDVALDLLRLHPLHVQAAWAAGLVLDEAGLADDAAVFFEHAVNIYRLTGETAPVPADRWLDLTHNLLVRGEFETALAACRRAVEADPTRGDAAFLLYWLLGDLDRTEDADALRDALAKRFDAIEDPASASVADAAQAAWFYCMIAPDAPRALALAQSAFERAPEEPLLRRVLGYAQSLSEQGDAALETLNPIVETDPYAACVVAKLLRERRDEIGARRTLKQLKHVETCGPAVDLMLALGSAGEATLERARTAHPDRAAVAKRLDAFDRGSLVFHREPARYLEATLTVDSPNVQVGERWWAEITLHNKASFPITLGADWLVNPVVLASFSMEGDKPREAPGLMTITLDERAVLKPGESVSVRLTLDVGPLRRAARFTPQQLQTVTASAILDPVRLADGRWEPGLTGQRIEPACFTRQPALADDEYVSSLFDYLRVGPDERREEVVRVMAELVGEQQRAAYDQLTYSPTAIPTGRLLRALQAALTKGSPRLRAQALDALFVAGLDQQTIAAASENLEHPHWLVRMLAVRLLARQGAPFAEEARRIANEDEDALVRRYAASYAAKLSSGTTDVNADAGVDAAMER